MAQQPQASTTIYNNDDSRRRQQQQVKHRHFLPSELIVHDILPFCDRKTITNVAYGNREFYELVMKHVQLPWPTNVPLPFQKNAAIVERRRQQKQRQLRNNNNDDNEDGDGTNEGGPAAPRRKLWHLLGMCHWKIREARKQKHGTNDEGIDEDSLTLKKVASNGKTGTDGYIAVSYQIPIERIITNTNIDIFIQVWNCHVGYTSQLVLTYRLPFFNVNILVDMEFSPTIPHLLLTGNYDGTVDLWDVRQNPLHRVYQFHSVLGNNNSFLQAFFTPKGHTVVVTR